jgi:hypothetical protein
VLEKTMAVVALGRERLRPEIDGDDPRFGDQEHEPDDAAEVDEEDEEPGGTVVFFDQDK